MQMAHYELWDTDSRSLIGDYDREEDALAVVRLNVSERGPSVVEGVALLRVGGAGEPRVVAEGKDLLQRLARSRPDARAG